MIDQPGTSTRSRATTGQLRGRRPRATRPARASGMLVDPADWLLRGGLALAGALSRYHRHRIKHLERLVALLKAGRRVVLVGNHALDVVDALLRALNAGDDRRYRALGLRFGAVGVHLLPGVLPLPVRITHVLSGPLDLGDRRRARSEREALCELHARVWDQCQGLLDVAVADRRRESDRVDVLIRAGQRALQRIGI